MVKNYLKIAFRQLLKNKTQSIILVGGLAAGMMACMLLLQYVSYELSFDDFHSKRDQIYRVVNERIQNGESVQKGTITYPTIGAAMQKDFPEVVNHARVRSAGPVVVRHQDQVAPQESMIWVDEHFFEIFDFPVLAGEKVDLLSETNEVVLTRKVADQYFPAAKGQYDRILGQEVELNKNPDPYRIVGITENVPANSLLQFDVLVSFATHIRYQGQASDDSWTWSDFWHFVELQPQADVAALEAKLPAFSDRYFRGTEVSGSEEVFSLQPLADAHLYSAGLEYEIGETASGNAVWSLLIIAFFILIIAWVNYVNLSSVRAIERAREVGVRKVVGARRSALIAQFFTEALVVNVLALVLAWLGAHWVKPAFAANFGLEPSAMSFFTEGTLFLPLTMLGLLAAGLLISGAYPAWLLSSPHVSNVLKGAFQRNMGGGTLRKALVVFQFTASIALITGTWLVARQINFMNKQDLGVNIDQVMTIQGPGLTSFDSTFIDEMNAFKDKLLTNPHILNAATANRTLGDDWQGRAFQIAKLGEDAGTEQFTSSFIMTDYGYADTYDMELLAGRFFRPTDHHPDFQRLENIVLTEAAVKMFGYPNVADAVGQRLNFWDKNWTVVGVLPDYHSRSLHHPIEPLIFVPAYGTGNALSLRLDGEDMESTIGFIQSTFQDFFPGNIFEYAFVDESFQRLYESDRRFGRILVFFTFLTVLIACLGLFGLATYMTFLRTKEIGVRKVLGASVASLLLLLSRDFLRLVLLALVIAIPLAWFFSRQWLMEFPYRVDIEWWMFAAAGLGAILIAFVAVSAQSAKVAMANPVQSLRSE
ncbi:ABC transporter permease [Flavilitoribacter nigricans]|uniref:ABC transporter permease n=1 Tax=Flavilitoribacter nigricans (strain ATCC 23147 / DSM 23189 / NBRC 102662 / NCIMB 1420 / SS-2) TaxID=1122177 RepID=A0A2D0N6W8_FLAN2|nr:ABC transporter permease [Flavilitoribacter nigricans]PHN04126.1 hypothetical protein CRP01_23300 [Flavilitoribacter nigricans DSM 23189 = NBRC 102662]